MTERAPDPDNIGEYLISARSFPEYRAMFDLSDADLRGSILDCPGGGSDFTAQARARGADAIAVDPAYAIPAPQLGAHVLAETDRGSAHTAAGHDRYRWDFYGDPAGHRAMRARSARGFARDLAAHPERYVAGALPSLPFPDGRFDLVLSSHFLFTYADRLDAGFHLAALQEMRRVCTGEVRVFPLLDQGGHSLDPLVDDLKGALAGRGVHAVVRRVPYEFQRGGDRMLVLAHPSPP